MYKVLKVVLKKFVFILLFTAPVVNAGGGDSWAGGLAGGVLGGMLTSQGRSRQDTVVVQDSGSVTREELIRLEQVIRRDLNRIYDRLRENEYKFKSQIRELENKIRRLQNRSE